MYCRVRTDRSQSKKCQVYICESRRVDGKVKKFEYYLCTVSQRDLDNGNYKKLANVGSKYYYDFNYKFTDAMQELEKTNNRLIKQREDKEDAELLKRKNEREKLDHLGFRNKFDEVVCNNGIDTGFWEDREEYIYLRDNKDKLSLPTTIIPILASNIDDVAVGFVSQADIFCYFKYKGKLWSSKEEYYNAKQKACESVTVDMSVEERIEVIKRVAVPICASKTE